MFSEKEIHLKFMLYLNEKPYFKFEIRLFILGKMCQKLFLMLSAIIIISSALRLSFGFLKFMSDSSLIGIR